MESFINNHYLSGEKELADKLRGFVEPLRKQQETKEEQALIFTELGHLHLQTAIVEQDGARFTKASALFNAALVRTSNSNQERKIKESLLLLKNAIIETFFGDEKSAPITLTQWEQNCRDNKQSLDKMRQSIENACSNLRNIMERYDVECNDRHKMERVLVNEIQIVSLLVKEEMMLFIKMLWEQVLSDADLKPPYKYSLLALGSLARQEATPFSDLEFAILVEKQSLEVQEYFKKLTYLFHLHVLDLGETPIPCLAIASLNDFMTPDGDWFYDKVTPSGFKLDGAMPWACKTPIGRHATDTKEPLSFIRTPKEMADLQRVDNNLGQAYHVADVLSQTLLVLGDHGLHKIYHQEILNVVESSFDAFRKRGFIIMKADRDRHALSESINQFGYINAKVGVYRFPSTFVENLRLIYTPLYFGGSQWCTLKHLVEKRILSEKGAFNLKVGLAISLTLRLLTYFRNKGQDETILVFQNHDEDISTSHIDRIAPQAYMDNTDLYVRCEQTIWGIKKMITSRFGSRVELPDNLLGEIFFEPDQDEAFQTTVEANEVHLHHNFMWAVLNTEIPPYSCGVNCLRDQVENLDTSSIGIDKKIHTVNILLQKTDQCICLATLELHLKIYKHILLKKADILTDTSNININYVLEVFRESKSRSVRDNFFLLLGMFGMVSSYTDEKIVTYIIGTSEMFLKRTKDLPPLERNFILRLEIEFIYGLLYLYKLVGQTDKIVTVCESWIQKIERPLRSIGSTPQLVYFYSMLSRELYRNPERRKEAIALKQKALKICETISSVETVAIEVLCDNVITLASWLEGENRKNDAVALLTKYFISGKDSYGFTNHQFIKASQFLVSCHLNLGNVKQALEVFEQVHGLVKNETPRGLNFRERYAIAYDYVYCYGLLGRREDVPQVFDFHALLCQAENNPMIRLLEMKSFIIPLAMKFLLHGEQDEEMCMYGVNLYERALSLDQPTADLTQINKKTVTWIAAFINLCDVSQISETEPSKSFFVVDFIFKQADDALKLYHPCEYEITFILSKIYLDYRRCIHYLDMAVNRHGRYLNDTIGFLQQTQVLIDQYFPQSTSASKWISYAIDTAEATIRKIPSEQRCVVETFITDLILQRKSLLGPQYISNKLKTIISYI